MTKPQLNDVIVSESTSIKKAMKVIDSVGLRLVYVVEEKKGQLKGVVSDSEVRRAIIKGIDIQDSVGLIVNPCPFVLHERDFNNSYTVKKIARQLYKMMPDSKYILILDKYDRPKELQSLPTLIGSSSFIVSKSKPNKNVLIVGGAGYLGTVLSQKLLDRGYYVRILDNFLYGSNHIKYLKNFHCDIIEGDMRDISTTAQALKKIDVVINLAAIVGDPACNQKPEDAIETNYLANKALAEACKYHQINKYIYASTCSVYGASIGDVVSNESSAINPISLYARSKIQSEEGLLSLEDENFSPIILRMATLYGYSPRMRFDLAINAMTKTAVTERKIYVDGDGTQWRPFLSVSDAADAYITCIKAPLDQMKGQIINLGISKNNYQINHIANIIHACVKKSKIILRNKKIDRRNYIVSFEKASRLLHLVQKKPITSFIREMIRVIKTGLILDVNDPVYYNTHTDH